MFAPDDEDDALKLGNTRPRPQAFTRPAAPMGVGPARTGRPPMPAPPMPGPAFSPGGPPAAKPGPPPPMMGGPMNPTPIDDRMAPPPSKPHAPPPGALVDPTPMMPPSALVDPMPPRVGRPMSPGLPPPMATPPAGAGGLLDRVRAAMSGQGGLQPPDPARRAALLTRKRTGRPRSITPSRGGGSY